MKSYLVALLLLFVSLVAVYGLTLRGVPGNPTPKEIVSDLNRPGMPFESSLARGRFAQTMAIADDGVFDLRNGKELIPMPDLGFYQGRFYSLFAPGVPVYSVPAYIIGKSLGHSQLVVNAFLATVAVFSSVLIFVLARKLGATVWASFFGGLSYGLGTTAWPYAVSIAQHNMSVFFLLTIILSGIAAKKYWWGFWVGWLCYGLAVMIDYPNALLLLPAVLFMCFSALSVKLSNARKYILKFRLSLVYGFVAFLVVGTLHGLYNQVNFGSPTRIGTVVYERVKSEEQLEMLRGSSVPSEDSDASSLEAAGLFDVSRMPRGMNVLLFSKGRGIVFYAPLMLMGGYGFYVLRKEQFGIASALVATIVANVVLYSSFGDPWGGWEFGPRYLIPSMAVMAVGLAIVLTRIRMWWVKFLALVLFVYGSGVNMLAVLTTNQLPAEVEAIPAGLPYTYLHNLDLLKKGMVSSFSYKFFLVEFVDKGLFVLVLALFIVMLGLGSLFVAPVLGGKRER